MKIKELLKKIKKEINIKIDEKPIKDFIEKLKKEIKKQKIKADVFVGGSYAKKTFLSNDFDVDIFIRFNKKEYQTKDISKELEKVIKKVFKEYVKVHGSRDYFQVYHNSIKFEIVPVLKINKCENPENITDCSPLHVKWIKGKINKNKKLIDEIKLGKLFLKANKLYGAESYINGFSGHVLDILIVYYGSFEKWVKAASKWKEKEFIDVEKHYKNKNEALLNIDVSKREGPLLVVDPIDKTRNAAAALSKEKYKKFIMVCKNFIKKPSKKFFEIKKLNEEGLKKPFIKFVLEVEKNKSSDVQGSKALKLLKYYSNFLTQNKYKNKIAFEWDKKGDFFGYILIDKKSFEEKEFVKQGPSIDDEKNVKEFKKKNKNWFVKNKRIFAKVKKKEIKQLIKEMKKDNYWKEKVEKIKKIELIEK